MATRVTWYPAALPSASPLVLDAAAGSNPYLLLVDGLGPLTGAPIVTKGPSQEGETALDVTIPPRVITVQARLDAASLTALFEAQATIARALVNIPVRFGGEISLGRLLIERPGLDDREIYGLPGTSSIDKIKGANRALIDADWHCPYPYFQPTSDTVSAEIEVDASETVANAGDVDAPFVARIYGPATELALTNLTTGEVLTVTVTLADATEWLEVDTTPGVKTIRKYTDVDVWENAISGLSLADGRLFLLRPGNNSIKLEAVGDDVNTVAELTYKPRYAGL